MPAGIAKSKAIKTSFKKSFDSIVRMFCTEAPNTLRIPISLCVAKHYKQINQAAQNRRLV